MKLPQWVFSQKMTPGRIGLLVARYLLIPGFFPASQVQNESGHVGAETAQFRGSTDLVRLTVSVTDHLGRALTGLTKDDIQVFEDKVEQKIEYFIPDTSPLAQDLVLDSSGSMGRAKHLTLTKDNFQTEVLGSTTPVLVDFWATWCGPCSVIAPVIEEVAGDFEGRAKVGKLDVDEHASIAMKYGIRSIPTLLFFKDGEVVDQLVGVVSKQLIAGKLNALVAEEVALVN